MHPYFAPPFTVEGDLDLINAKGQILCHASHESDEDGAAPWLHDIAAALNASAEKSVPVSVILEEAASVMVYVCRRIAECRALESRALKHSDFWVSRCIARLDSLHWVLSMAGHEAESREMKNLYSALHREWCKVRAATNATIINWD